MANNISDNRWPYTSAESIGINENVSISHDVSRRRVASTLSCFCDVTSVALAGAQATNVKRNGAEGG